MEMIWREVKVSKRCYVGNIWVGTVTRSLSNEPAKLYRYRFRLPIPDNKVKLWKEVNYLPTENDCIASIQNAVVAWFKEAGIEIKMF